MPIIKSAIKRARQNPKRRERNRAAKSEIRTLVKACRQAIAQGELGQARTLARQAQSRLDKAAKKGIIHANTARRKGMRLHRAVTVAGPAQDA